MQGQDQEPVSSRFTTYSAPMLYWPWRILRSPEILGNIARPLSILLRGLEALWSPWIGISAPYPCATLVLALALALAPARLRSFIV
jgi:hypothetical protein